MSLRSSLKRLGRKTAKVRVKVGRIATPLIAAGAASIGGVGAGAAVTAAGAQFAYYNRATQARNEGKFGRSARSLGRGERKRVAIYGAAGTGAGALASGGMNLFAGKSFSSSLGATFFGQGGAQLLGIDNTIFAKAPFDTTSTFVTAGNLAAQKGSSVPGLVTQADLNAVLHGGAAEAAGAGQVAGVTGTSGSALTKALGLANVLGDAYGKASKSTDKSKSGSSEFEHLLDQLGAGVGGGGAGDAGSGGGLGSFFNSPAEGKMSPALIAALAVGAFLLLA